ncbi:MAG: hypothetical protein KC422_02485 [Trueperaceae bacterium]|nr:hypothetical protein [Trueperaceae bacterium]
MNKSLLSALFIIAGILCILVALIAIVQNFRLASQAGTQPVFPILRLFVLAMLAGALFSASHYVRQNK